VTNDQVATCLSPWLLCIHNIPPKPPYLRAKAAKRLAALGAVPVKNAVYVLPNGERQRDGLVWLAREIEQGGGRAYVCGASFDVTGGGINDNHIKKLFVDARESDYRTLAAEFQTQFEALNMVHDITSEQREMVQGWTAQLRARFEVIHAIDFFGTPGCEAVEGMLAGAGRWLRMAALGGDTNTGPLNPALYTGRTWVTRPSIHIDRIASAWLIRRFIDPMATFRFDGRVQTSSDIRFDMPEAEFTHEGSLCTFEVLIRRFSLDSNPALNVLCQVIHDIDLDEATPVRAESAGIAALLHGICLQTDSDMARLEYGAHLLSNLYEHFERTTLRSSKE